MVFRQIYTLTLYILYRGGHGDFQVPISILFDPGYKYSFHVVMSKSLFERFIWVNSFCVREFKGNTERDTDTFKSHALSRMVTFCAAVTSNISQDWPSKPLMSRCFLSGCNLHVCASSECLVLSCYLSNNQRYCVMLTVNTVTSFV